MSPTLTCGLFCYCATSISLSSIIAISLKMSANFQVFWRIHFGWCCIHVIYFTVNVGAFNVVKCAFSLNSWTSCQGKVFTSLCFFSNAFFVAFFSSVYSVWEALYHWCFPFFAEAFWFCKFIVRCPRTRLTIQRNISRRPVSIHASISRLCPLTPSLSHFTIPFFWVELKPSAVWQRSTKTITLLNSNLVLCFTCSQFTTISTYGTSLTKLICRQGRTIFQRLTDFPSFIWISGIAPNSGLSFVAVSAVIVGTPSSITSSERLSMRVWTLFIPCLTCPSWCRFGLTSSIQNIFIAS